MPKTCGHCGRERTLENKGMVELTSNVQEIDHGAYREEIDFKRIAEVFYCSACGEVTLTRYLWMDQYFDAETVDVEVLYPEPQALEGISDEVRFRYGAMLELQHAPDAFAVRAGRLLEAICADQGVSAEGLSQREEINALLDQADLPKPLVSQAHLIYTYRNYGGHTKEFEVEEDDVPLIRGFIEALLDFLYRGPANLDRVSAALEKRKAAALDEID